MAEARKTMTYAVRDDFPALGGRVNGRLVSYLDSAASAQKPYAVIAAMRHVMETHYANVHRGVYDYGAKTSIAFEAARARTAKFLNAGGPGEIVFTRNATEAINLVAASWGGRFVGAGDEILVTELEHHANIVPWHMLCERKGAVLKAVPVLPDGSLDMEAFARLVTGRTKMIAVTQMSNALGTITPLAEIAALARGAGAKLLVDGSQGAVHLGADVKALDCDFYVFTGHKLYGPTGVGALWGRPELLAEMPPWQGGGEMIEEVAFDRVTYKEPPYRFEAGTPPIVEAVGLGAAIDYAVGLGYAETAEHEARLLAEAERRLSAVPGVTIYSRAAQRAAILSFNVGSVHPHDVATVFDQVGLCVRAGHHCCQPLMKALGVTATVRASFAAYNTMEDVDRLEEGVDKVRRLFKA